VGKHLPVISGRETVQAFESLGWQFRRQHGSHMILVREGSDVTLSVPDHHEVAKGTLRTLIRRAGLTVDQFAAALD
jgi:predicted RNA binding protein YcfA (HicA-like mRNA interferase family)